MRDETFSASRRNKRQMAASAASEDTLMRAYVAGDRHAFSRLFERLAPDIHAFFVRSLRSRTIAEDLVQTTFLKLHRARARWRPDLPVRPWVFAIAARVRQDHLRRARGLAEVAGEDEIAAAEAGGGAVVPELEGGIFQKSRAERVRHALDTLPESQRIVIHLHRYEGMTFADVARVLGTTEGAVKLRAFRGYERLRSALADLLREDA
jgi:RNA polymerase sigma-70 factor (ECF subfamily)